jgi:hypothetical protein
VDVLVLGLLVRSRVCIVENRTLQPATYLLSIDGIKDAELIVPQNPFLLPPNTAVKMSVYVSAKRKDLIDRITRLRFTLESISSRETRIVQEAPFVYPDRTDKGLEI